MDATIRQIRELVDSVDLLISRSVDHGAMRLHSPTCDSNLESTLDRFGYLVAAIDWKRFLWEGQQLKDPLTSGDLDHRWKLKIDEDDRCANQHACNAEVMLAHLTELGEQSRNQNAQQAKVYKLFEAILHVERDLIKSFPQPLPSDFPDLMSKRPWWELTIRHESPYATLTYEREVASSVHELLKHMPSDLQRHPAFVIRCGRIVEIILDADYKGDGLQSYYELREYVENNESDIEALIWLGQFESLLGNTDAAFTIGKRLWNFVEKATPNDVYVTIKTLFEATHEELSIHIAGVSEDLAYRVDEWDGFESEPLIESLIRKAFESDLWTDSLIDYCATAFPGYQAEESFPYFPSHSLLGFLGRLEFNRIVDQREFQLRNVIELAIDAARRECDETALMLATELYVAFLLYQRENNEAVLAVASSATSIRSNTNRKRLASVLSGIQLLRQDLSYFQLGTKETTTLLMLLSDYHEELQQLRTNEESQAIYSTQQSPLIEFRQQCHSTLTQRLGPKLWAMLHSDTQRELVAAEEQFLLQSQYEGDTGNFDYVPIALGKAVFNEALLCIRKKLPHTAELATLWPMNEQNLGTLVKFLERLDDPNHAITKQIVRSTAILRILLAVKSLKSHLDELLQLRNSGAHKRTDRERAILLRADWFGEQNVLFRLMSALHPVV